ncbi:MAG TPA: polysaccharide deacetylase family protein [Candidatus Limnocylindrales bacterium]|nr:polysaccharide deacetylase family protein [Candidatus Limnocylindrales bacterium]
MSLRPLAVSVVLAAALLGANVLRDGSGAVLPDPAPDPTPATAVRPSATPAASVAPGSASGAPTPPPARTPDGPVTAADRFRTWENGPRREKLVALTFDDGWNGRILRRLVAILEAKDAPATFFPVARAVQRNPETWRAIAAAGYPIGNHSWNHDDLTKGKSSKAAKDIVRATRAIETVTREPLFAAIRPPYGLSDKSFLAGAQAAGMQAVIMWDLDTRDWTGRPASQVVKAAMDAKPGSIIVLHTDKSNTVKALPKIIDGLRARGFRLVTVGQLIGLPGPVPQFEDRALRDAQRGR